LENLGVAGKDILRWIFKKRHRACPGLIFLRTRTGDGLLFMLQ
jgi:hypothetical protein